MKTKPNPQVDAFFRATKEWREESIKLRAIILDFPLTEELKWNKPCYSHAGSNLLIIQAFKGYCALMFCKGALLKDAHRILVKPGENTQAARQARFTSISEIVKLKTILKAYIQEAIAAEKAGLKVTFKKITDFKAPEELQAKLDANPALKKAFQSLTPGRQRHYFLHISSAKQSSTRTARVEKCIPQILKGKGFND
jgi:uncharacterized protein YdeI (YjbR/CyaY-like superfamily)